MFNRAVRTSVCGNLGGCRFERFTLHLILLLGALLLMASLLLDEQQLLYPTAVGS